MATAPQSQSERPGRLTKEQREAALADYDRVVNRQNGAEKEVSNVLELGSLAIRIENLNELVSSSVGIKISFNESLHFDTWPPEKIGQMEHCIDAVANLIEKVKTGDIDLELPSRIVFDGQGGVFFRNGVLSVGLGSTEEDLIKTLEVKTTQPDSITVPEIHKEEQEKLGPSNEERDLAFVLNIVRKAGASPEELSQIESWLSDKKIQFVPGNEVVLNGNELSVGDSTTSKLVYEKVKSLLEGGVVEPTDVVIEKDNNNELVEPAQEAGDAEPQLDLVRNEYARMLEEARKSGKGKEDNFDPEKLLEAEKKYYALLETQKELIREEVYKKHEVSGHHEDASRVVNANIELKRRVMDEIVEAEHKRLSTTRESLRGNEGKPSKAKELFVKSLQWYSSKNKYARLVVTTALFTTGYAIGGLGIAGAVGYGAFRFGRGLASIGAGALATAYGNKKWSLEEAEKKGMEKKQNIAESLEDSSLKSAMKEYSKIEDETRADKKSRILKRTALAMGAGAGAGILAGAIEHLGGGSAIATESPRFAAVRNESLGGTNTITETQIKPNVSTAEIPEEKVTTIEPPPVAEGISDFLPEKLVTLEPHKVDSIWKLTEEGLKDYDKYSSLNQAQKTWVISHITNRDYADPSSFGLPGTKNSVPLMAGEEIDVSKVIGSKSELDSVIEKASKLSEAQQNSILKQTNSVKAFVDTHPGVDLNKVEVADILTTKPVPSTPIGEPFFTDTDHVATKLPEDFRRSVNTNELADQIQLAKTNPEPVPQGLPQVKSLKGDMLNGIENRQYDAIVNQTFREGVHGFYGKEGILGLGKVEGINSDDWKFVSRLPAKKVLEFYTTDSETSDLPTNIQAELADPKLPHRDMMTHVVKDWPECV